MGEAENLAALMAMPGQWVDRIRQRRPMQKLILDMDSSVSRKPLRNPADQVRLSAIACIRLARPLFPLSTTLVESHRSDD